MELIIGDKCLSIPEWEQSVTILTFAVHVCVGNLCSLGRSAKTHNGLEPEIDQHRSWHIYADAL